MNDKTIIFIGGYLAAGKTTFSEYLSRQLQVLCVNKDYMKEILCDAIGFEDRTQNLKMSHATFNVMLHLAEQSMKVGQSIILESNFRPTDGEQLFPLIKKYGYTAVTIMMVGDLQVLYERFVKRLEGRHPAHLSATPDFDGFVEHCTLIEQFNICGERIIIDMTDLESIAYDNIIHTNAQLCNLCKRINKN